MRLFLCSLAFLLIGSAAVAQNETPPKRFSVSGRVIDDVTGKGIAYAEIHVTDSLGNRVTRSISMDDGSFWLKLPDGSFSAVFKHSGYKNLIREIHLSGSDAALGILKMEEGEELDAASITATPLLSRKVDRIVYDVSKDPDADKIDMAQMMEKIPELHISSHNGKLEYTDLPVQSILIDDRENGIINVRRQYPMHFIKASHMSKIELVLPDSPEYQNKRPILLVTLSRDLPYGFAGELSFSADTRNAYEPASDVILNTPLLGIGMGYSFSSSHPRELTKRIERDILSTENEFSSSVSSTTNGNESLRHHLHIDLFRSFFNGTVKFRSSFHSDLQQTDAFTRSSANYFLPDGSLSRQVLSETRRQANSPFRINGTISLGGEFGPEYSVGKTVRKLHKWDLKYAYLDHLTHQTSLYNQDISWSDSEQTSSREHRIKFDLQLRGIIPHPFRGNLSFSTGYYNRTYGESLRSDNNNLHQDRGLSYNQQVLFLRTALMGNLWKKDYSYLLSLNAEHVGNQGSSLLGDNVSQLDYSGGNLIPYLSLTRRLKHGSVSLSYTEEVKRPSVYQLSPSLDYSNPDNLQMGNPEIKGSKSRTEAVSFNWRPGVKWIRTSLFSLSATQTRGSIDPVVNLLPDGTTMTSYENLGRRSSVAFLGSMELAPVKKVSISLHCSLSWNRSVFANGQKNDWWRFHGSISTRASFLSLDWRSTFSLAPTLSSPQSKSLILEPDWDISVSRYFKKPHLGVSLSTEDLLHGAGNKESVIGNADFTQRTYQERLGRSIRLRIYWQFGRFRENAMKPISVDAYDM